MSNTASSIVQTKTKPGTLAGQTFTSKSPNPQSIMMANTNYGKFKGIAINNNQNSAQGGNI